MSIGRTTWTDDDGTGTTGTVINNAEKTALYDQIDGRWSINSPTSTGNQDDFNYSEADLIRANNASTVTFRGLLAPASPVKPAKHLTIVSVGAGSVVLNDQDANSTAANRIITGTSAALTLAAGTGWAILVYDSTTARWRVIGSSAAGGSTVQPLNRNVTPASNGTTVETTLMTYTLPAGKLGTNGDTVRMKAYGSHAANGNTKTLRMYFGATLVATYAATPNGLGWIVEAEVSRTGATAQVAFGSVENGSSGKIMTNSTPAETLSGTIVIKITGQSATASNDITANGFSVELVPNA